MRKLFLSLITIGYLFLGGIAQAGDLADQIETQSRYYGVGWQNDGNHWSIELLIEGDRGQIAYPSIDCSGTWTQTGKYAAQIEYTEQILDGIEECIELGTVVIEPLDNGRLLYTWMEQVPKVDARAVLVPVNGQRMSYHDLMMLTLTTVNMDFLLPEFHE